MSCGFLLQPAEQFNSSARYLFSVGFMLLKSRRLLEKKTLEMSECFFFLPRPAKVLTPLCRKKIIWIWGILRYSCFHRVRQSCIMMVLSGPVKTAKEIQSKRREGSFSALSDNEVDGCAKSSQEVNDEVLLSRCIYNI